MLIPRPGRSVAIRRRPGEPPIFGVTAKCLSCEGQPVDFVPDNPEENLELGDVHLDWSGVHDWWFTYRSAEEFPEGTFVYGLGTASRKVRSGLVSKHRRVSGVTWLQNGYTVRTDSLSRTPIPVDPETGKPPVEPEPSPERDTPRQRALTTASNLVHSDRNEAYGPPTENFETTAALLNAQFAHKLKIEFTAADVAVIMIQLKMARMRAGVKADHWHDVIGYAACGYECDVAAGNITEEK